MYTHLSWEELKAPLHDGIDRYLAMFEELKLTRSILLEHTIDFYDDELANVDYSFKQIDELYYEIRSWFVHGQELRDTLNVGFMLRNLHKEDNYIEEFKVLDEFRNYFASKDSEFFTSSERETMEDIKRKENNK